MESLPAELFAEIHDGLPREGPGDTASTRRALAAVQRFVMPDRIADIGCGPGLQTVDLAMSTKASVVAIDLHDGYLRRLRIRAARSGVDRRVRAVRATMFSLPLQHNTADVVWAEGSIYIIGFERGLSEWQRLLRPGGCIAASHLSWLSDHVPDEPRRFWAAHYPALTTVDENLRIARTLGYEVIDCFPLPEHAWWNDYYAPLEERLSTLRVRYAANGDALTRIEQTREQIELYKRFSAVYGYVFYVLRAP
jgi:ubiquinone/menaquinone biosynthesis C-methylase UbiE